MTIVRLKVINKSIIVFKTTVSLCWCMTQAFVFVLYLFRLTMIQVLANV